MDLRLWFVGILVLSVCATIIIYTIKSDEYERSRELIAFRQVGHQILLTSKDSSSRVLPVNRSSANLYQLNFETAFALVPDSLVKTVTRVMQKNSISTDYIVNVLDSENNQLVYGFAISKTSDNIIPCMGRVLPEKKYRINIIPQTKSTSIIYKNRYPFLAFFLVVSISGATLYTRRRKTLVKEIAGHSKPGTNPIMIGEYLFYPDSSLLMHQHTPFILTAKESKLLAILISDVNTLIDRSRLLKEGWEDEGVITQRSLDMYISRLRKKLINDPSVKITSVHGKGYRLNTP